MAQQNSFSSTLLSLSMSNNLNALINFASSALLPCRRHPSIYSLKILFYYAIWSNFLYFFLPSSVIFPSKLVSNDRKASLISSRSTSIKCLFKPRQLMAARNSFSFIFPSLFSSKILNALMRLSSLAIFEWLRHPVIYSLNSNKNYSCCFLNFPFDKTIQL